MMVQIEWARILPRTNQNVFRVPVGGDAITDVLTKGSPVDKTVKVVPVRCTPQACCTAIMMALAALPMHYKLKTLCWLRMRSCVSAKARVDSVVLKC